jgi:transposase
MQAVCCDLWGASAEAIREEILTARITADRCHVARHYRDATDQLRKQEFQRLKKELSKVDYQKLNGSFRVFRTPALPLSSASGTIVASGVRENAKDLKQEERKTLRGFFEYSPCAKQAYDFREGLTAIYEMNISRKQAQSKILHWRQQVQKSGLRCFDDFICLLHNWWEEITNFFIRREKVASSKGSTTRSKSSSGVVTAFSTSSIYSSVSTWT